MLSELTSYLKIANAFTTLYCQNLPLFLHNSSHANAIKQLRFWMLPVVLAIVACIPILILLTFGFFRKFDTYEKSNLIEKKQCKSNKKKKNDFKYATTPREGNVLFANLVSQSFCSESYQDNDVSSSFTKCRSKKIFDNDLTLSPLRSFMDSGKDQLQDYLLDSSLKKDASTTSSEQTNTDVENYQDKVEATVKDCMILKQDLEHFISNKNQSLQREESMKTPEGIKSHLSDFIRGDLESYQDVVRKLKETPVHFNQKRSRSLVSNAVSKFRHSLKHKRSSSVAIENPYKKNSKSIIKKRFLYKRKL